MFKLKLKVAIGDSTSTGLIKVYQNTVLVQSFTAHTAYIHRLKAIPNGMLVSAGDDSTAKIWNTTNWNLISSYTGHSSGVVGLEYIDCDTLASSSNDYTIKIWRIASGSTLLTISLSDIPKSLQLLSNGFLVSGQLAGGISIWNYNTGALIRNLVGHTSEISYILLLNSQVLSTSSGDMKTIIWNLTTGLPIYTLVGHTNQVRGAAIISSSLIATGSYDFSAKIWNWNTGTLIRTLSGHTNKILRSLDLYSTDVLITGSYDTTVKLWQISTGILLQTINTGISIYALTMLKDCKDIF